MIIQGLEILLTRKELEDVVVKICNNKFVSLEFDQSYEPEIKLKIIYDLLYDISFKQSHKDDEVSIDKYYIDILYGILRRYDVTERNYNVIYHIVLTIELIKPNDVNAICIAVNVIVFI